MARTTSRHRCSPNRPCYTNRKVAAIFQHYYSGGGGTAYEPEYQAALNAGFGTPPATDAGKLAESNIIKTAKALGLWDAAARFYIMDSVSADPDWKSINYKDVGNTSTYILRINSPTTGAKQGWTGNGSTAYLDFQFIPSTDGGSIFTLNDAGVIAFAGLDNTANAVSLVGVRSDISSNDNISLNPRRLSDGNATGSINDGTLSTLSVEQGNGLYIIRRIDSNNARISKNGGSESINGSASGSLATISMYGLARHIGESADTFSANRLDLFIPVKGSAIVPADVNTWYNNWIIERDAV